MRNETCVETQTSKVPTRVAFLFISILCIYYGPINLNGLRFTTHTSPKVTSPKVRHSECSLVRKCTCLKYARCFRKVIYKRKLIYNLYNHTSPQLSCLKNIPDLTKHTYTVNTLVMVPVLYLYTRRKTLVY